MTRNELNEYALEVHSMPNGREKFRLEDLIEMARHGLPERIEEVEETKSELADLREQVGTLESKVREFATV